MKIRIPLVLRAAVLSAIALSVSSQATAEEIVLSLDTTEKKITGDLTVSGDERVGYIENDDSLYTEFVLTNNNKRTQNLTVTGNLTIEGNAQVAVGGGLADSGQTAKLKVDGTLTVNDNGYLKTSKADVANLVINSGRVDFFTGSTHGLGSGNSYYSSGSTKQAHITSSLQINGGKLFMGAIEGAYVTNASTPETTKHAKIGFKGSISQTGGFAAIRGDVTTSGAVTISQTGNKASTMYFTDDLNLGGKLTVNQNNSNASLVIGRLTGSQNVDINQSAGYLQLATGAYLTSARTISLKQTGNGTIDIGGGLSTAALTEAERNKGYYAARSHFFNQKATYAIEQSGKGGNITLKAGTNLTKKEAANITVSSLNQSAGNTITVESGAGLTISAATATIGGTLANSGTVTANSLSVAGTFQNMATLTATSVSFADGGEIVNTGTMTIDNLNLDNGTLKGAGTYEVNSDITIDSGTFEFTLADAVVTTSLSDTSNFGGTMLDMNGNDLTIGSGAEIALGMSGDVQAMFESMLADDDMAPVNFTMQVARGIGNIEDIDLTSLKEQTAHTAYLSNISYSKDGSGNLFVTGTLAPEPTTATLSLMALAALAARRRRR